MRKIFYYILLLLIIFNCFALAVNVRAINGSHWFNVDPSPSNAGINAGYHIYGGISDSDNVDGLLIKFPYDTTFLFNSIQGDAVIVNSTPSIYCTINYEKDLEGKNQVALRVLLGKKLKNGENIDILISASAGIVNPSIPKPCYTLRVSLLYQGYELDSIGSDQYEIKQSKTRINSIDLSNPLVASKSSYKISFFTGVNGNLSAEKDDIRIKFPQEVLIPNSLFSKYVMVNGKRAYSVYLDRDDSSVLVIYPSTDIPSNSLVNVELSESFGIVNPRYSGRYQIEIHTYKEPDWSEPFSFEIFLPEVENFIVEIPNNAVNDYSSYTFRFKTSKVGILEKNQDKIYIEFPEVFEIPVVLPVGCSYVNGVPCETEVKGNVVIFDLPFDIKGFSDVEVLISVDAKIKNPSVASTYDFSIYTDSDIEKVFYKVAISESTIQCLKFTSSSSAASAQNSFYIDLLTGAGYVLKSSTDYITISFDSNFFVPNELSEDYISVNGEKPKRISVESNNLLIYVSNDILPKSEIDIKIGSESGIKNPQYPGVYMIRISSSKGDPPISVSVSVVDMPLVSIISAPDLPDGKNGIYISSPSVSLSSPNATYIYYKIDDGEFIEFTAAFNIPEGPHTVYAYAVDSGNNKGDIVKKEFLVDSTPPAIKFDNASSNPVFKGSPGKLYGSVSEPCTLKINESVLELKDNLNFSVELPNVYEGMPITVYMVDLAGNQNSLVLTAHIDNIPPVIKFLGDGVKYQNGMYSVETTDSYYTIRIQLNEKGKLFINSTEVISQDNSTFESMVNLIDGDNRFDVKAVDVAGNETVQILIVKKVNEKKIVLTVGSTLATVGNEPITLDAAPIIEQGVTLVPLRFIAEAFDSEVNWNGALQIITIVNKSHSIQLQINSKLVFIDNRKGNDLDVAPKIVNGRTFVPIRFISEAFGAEVSWDGATKTVTITYANAS